MTHATDFPWSSSTLDTSAAYAHLEPDPTQQIKIRQQIKRREHSHDLNISCIQIDVLHTQHMTFKLFIMYCGMLFKVLVLQIEWLLAPHIVIQVNAMVTVCKTEKRRME